MTGEQVQLLRWFLRHAGNQRRLGNVPRAMRIALGGLEFARRNIDPDDPEQAPLLFEALEFAAETHFERGEAPEAAILFREALELAERPKIVLPRLAVAQIHQQYAAALDQSGNAEDAAENYEKVLAVLRGIDPFPAEAIAHVANNLGMIRRDENRFDEARALYDEALEIFHRLGSAHALDLAAVYNNLGGLYWAWRQPETARDHHLAALKLRRERLPDSHPDIGQSACNLAAVYHDLGNFEKASRNYQRALKILHRDLHAHLETYQIVASNFATLLEEHSLPAKAAKLRERTEKHLTKARKLGNRRW
ncbi:MAG: tetratricopeptide repeat protein [Verrucomicrobiae bacterium]|nr:tetratricopeptide repeat protein [Verrucomicrobiae bacterium]MCP5539845.1 tetratricopeptide repeat protein [Akkermansiaceae bacterium]MCP5551931.1 tetratricopeptide repeat protein [Akkermansiaceae bacterium]